MAPHSTKLSLPASHAALADLFLWLGEQSVRLAVPEADQLRLQLIAEELFINTVDHGFGGKTGPDIQISLVRDGDATHLCYRDAAPPFDCVNATINSNADDVGGQGLALVRGMSRHLSYRRDGECNVIDVEI
mgnify:CR=1 FL=1